MRSDACTTPRCGAGSRTRVRRRAWASILPIAMLATSTVATADPAHGDALAPTTADVRQATHPADATRLPAPTPIPDHRLYLASLSIVRYNPLGLETQNRLVFQRRLAHSESRLLRDTFASGAASIKLNPAYLKAGPVVELQPVAVLNLRVAYEYVRYFGTQGYLQSSPDPRADFSDAARKDGKDFAYSTWGQRLAFEPTLQMKVGSVVLRSKFALEYWRVKLRAGATTFYDATLDTLVPGNGWVVTNDTDLLYLSGPLALGARFSGVWPRYASADYAAAGEPAGFHGNSHMRIGPLAAWSFDTREYTTFSKPTLLAITGWYLDHPSRQGAVPYVLVGFSFTSDLL